MRKKTTLMGGWRVGVGGGWAWKGVCREGEGGCGWGVAGVGGVANLIIY